MVKVLVLSGGGSKGAYQAGALQALKEHDIRFDLVSGVSAGALNGIMVALGRVEQLVQIWKTIRREDVFKKKSIVAIIARYLTYKIGFGSPPLSLYDNSPLRKLLVKELKDADLDHSIPYIAGRVDLNTGQYVNYIDPGHLIDIILSSTAEPVFYPPVRIGSDYYVDGGVRNITPLGDVLQYDPDEITIITTEPYYDPAKAGHVTVRDIVEIAESTLEILLSEIFLNDLRQYLNINKMVKQSHEPLYLNDKPLKYYETRLIMPEEKLGSSLDFSRKSLDKWFETGYNQTRSLLDNEKTAVKD